MRRILNSSSNQGLLTIITILTIFFILSTGNSFAEMGGLPGTADADFDPASDTEGNHCLNRFGKDFNQVYGLSEQFLTPLCNMVNSGEFYIPETAWFTNTENGLPGLPVTYPAGYSPAFSDPMDDFLSKIISVRYVVDEKKEYLFPAEDVVNVLTVGEIFPGLPGRPNETPLAAFLARLHPSPVGSHTVAILWILSGKHCNGLGSNPAVNCLQAGENFFTTRNFGVTPGAAQSQ